MLLRLLSINIWDLPIPLPWLQRTRRRRELLRQLAAAEADVVLLQEAFLPGFKRGIAASLPGHTADAYLQSARRHFRILPMDGSGGLVTFSRHPFGSSRYQPFRTWRGMKPDERIGRKGVLWSQLDAPGGPLLVGNVHLYAGTTPNDARARSLQVRHLLRRLAVLPRIPTVIAGDFNMTVEYEKPLSGPTGFDLMQDAGFAEAAGGATGEIATMSPLTNKFARYASFARPERRLTQVFFRGDGISVAEAPALCLHEPPVSDHFGLRTTFTIDAPGAGARSTPHPVSATELEN